MPRLRSSFLLVCLLVTLSLLAGSCAPKPAAAPTYTLKMHSALLRESVHGGVLDWYAGEIFKRTNGRVKIEVYHGGQLGGPREGLELASKGVAEIGNPVVNFLTDKLPLSGMTILPYLTASSDASMWAFRDLYKSYAPLREEFEVKQNVRLIYAWNTHIMAAGSRAPFTKMEDMKGKKWRGSGYTLEVIKMLGGSPVPSGIVENYEMLQKGVVEGNIGFPYDAIYSYKQYEVAPYIIDWSAGLQGFNYGVMNLDTWKKLPPDIQKVFDKIYEEEFIEHMTDEYNKAGVTATRAFQSANVKFYKLPPDEVARWKSVVLPTLWDNAIAKTPSPATSREFLEKYIALTQKYEAKSKYVHPFPK